MDFGKALSIVKNGGMIHRTGWNGKDLFVFAQVPAEIKGDIIPRMQSLPHLVKLEFDRRFNDSNYQLDSIYYSNQLALVDSSNMITGWSPSTSDALAEDWYIYHQLEADVEA